MQAMISTIQNAYQPCEMPKIFMKIKRQGTNKISCLMAALIILMIPFPGPEAKYPHSIVLGSNQEKMQENFCLIFGKTGNIITTDE